MRIKILVVVLFIIAVNCNGANNKKNVKNQWVDSIVKFNYTDTLNVKEHVRRLESFIQNGLEVDSNSTAIALADLTNRSDFYKVLGLERLIKLNKSLFEKCMVQTGYRLSYDDWGSLTSELRMCKIIEKDTTILNAVLSAVVISKPEDVHYSIVRFLSERGGFKIAKTFSSLLKKDFSNECKHNFLDCMVKFKVPEFDSIIKIYLNPKMYNDTLIPSVLYHMDAFERYDLLPELKTLRSSLKSGDIKTEDETLSGKIDEYISNLEQKKIENAPIGLPLDWPKSGPPNKWSGM